MLRNNDSLQLMRLTLMSSELTGFVNYGYDLAPLLSGFQNNIWQLPIPSDETHAISGIVSLDSETGIGSGETRSLKNSNELLG